MNLLRCSSVGNYDEVVTLLQNEQKGAAVNATFTDVYVRFLIFVYSFEIQRKTVASK